MHAFASLEQRASNQASPAERPRPFRGFDPYLPDHLNPKRFGPAPPRPPLPKASSSHKATNTQDQPEREFPGVDSLSVQPDLGSLQYLRHRRLLAPAVTLPTKNPHADLPDPLPSHEAIYHLFGYGDERSKLAVDHLTHGSGA